MAHPPAARWPWLALAAAALLPRVVGALVRRPWHDEYFTSWAAKLPFADLLAALRFDSGPPLPYVLVKLLALSGAGPIAAARACSVLAGTAAVLLAARAARGAFGAAAGWWTGAFLALHPLAVAWSCEGRAYAILLLAAAWAWERIEALARGGRGWIGLTLAVALACWTHGLGLLLTGVLAVVAVGLRPPTRLRVLAAVAVGLASHLPWLPIAAQQPPAAIAWMASAWRAMPAAERLVAPLRLLSPLGAYASALDLPSSSIWLEGAAAVVLAGLLLAGCRSPGAWRFALGAALPPLALGMMAALGVPALYPGRGEALALVPLALLVGAAAGHWRVARLAALALACGAAATVGRAEAAWAQEPPRSEARFAQGLRAALPNGGIVVIGGYWRLGIAYHLGTAAGKFDLVSFPAEAGRHPGWYDPTGDRPAPGELDALRARLNARRPVAIVLADGLPTARDLARLGVMLDLRPGLELDGATLLLPVARPDTG